MSKPNGNGGGRASMLAITREELEVLRREIDWIVGPLEDRTNCFKGGSFDARLRLQVHTCTTCQGCGGSDPPGRGPTSGPT